MNNTTQNRSGFSLLELSVTMLLIGISVAVAVPKIADSVTSTRLNSVSIQLMADIETARRHAASTGTTQQFQALVATNEYKLLNMPDINHPGTTGYIVDLDELQGSITLASVNLNGTNSMAFDMYGKPNHGGTIVLQSGSTSTTITVDGVTGKVSRL